MTSVLLIIPALFVGWSCFFSCSFIQIQSYPQVSLQLMAFDRSQGSLKQHILCVGRKTDLCNVFPRATNFPALAWEPIIMANMATSAPWRYSPLLSLIWNHYDNPVDTISLCYRTGATKTQLKSFDCSVTFSLHEVGLTELEYLWMVIAHNRNKRTEVI